MDKRKLQARRHQEDIALQRGLLWVGATVILEVLVWLLHKYYINYSVTLESAELAYTLRNLLKILRTAGPILAVVCLIWAWICFRKGGQYALSSVLALGLGGLSVCAHIALRFHAAGVQLLFLLVPACAGLALVFYLYQREFFLCATACGLSILGLWFVRYDEGLSIEAIGTLAAIAVVVCAALLLKRTDGTLKRGGVRVQILPENASYLIILTACLVSGLVVALALVLGAMIAYYLIFVMLAWLFALLVYYTVKLM